MKSFYKMQESFSPIIIGDNCKIFALNPEESCIELIKKILESPATKGCKVRIMPDTHAGEGICIGFTSELIDRCNPNYIGVDIGCGIKCFMFNYEGIEEKLPEFNSKISNVIPLGKEVNSNQDQDEKLKEEFFNILNSSFSEFFDSVEKHPYLSQFSTRKDFVNIDEKYMLKLAMKVGMKKPNTFLWDSLGTLGGGNHFIEMDSNKKGKYMVSIHTGSRNFGLKICKYHVEQIKRCNDDIWKRKVEEIKKNIVDKKELGEVIHNERKKFIEGLDCLKDRYLYDYLFDMHIAQVYAKYNRILIMRRICKQLGLNYSEESEDCFESVHNYINMNDWIIRKGSISANKGEKMIIPLNMRDGILICTGKGNEDWNNSAPHGAGRVMSRKDARMKISLKDYEKSMEGIYSTCVNESTIDESPFAYKKSTDIEMLIEPTAEIIDKYYPILNIKANE